MATVMQAIREYGGDQKPSVLKSSKPSVVPIAAPDSNDYEGPYEAFVALAFEHGDFAQIKNLAREARANKSRLSGGVWKIMDLYQVLGKPLAGNRATEDQWSKHIEDLKKWVAADPDSATARIALAQGYLNYAWFARGDGFSNTVSSSNWRRFHIRIALAKATLMEAAHLKEKCPYWFEAMQTVALAEGWQRKDARELFERAAAFEPTYYHYYREYAYYLLPRWHGEAGETQAFAEEVWARLPDPDGSMVYFEIASLGSCQCDPDHQFLNSMSWPKVTQGYAEMTHFYGTSISKANRFAYMSYAAQDRSSAQAAFSTVGTEWDQSVWNNGASFDAARAWAAAE